jgi:hypothetical protein
MMPWSFWLVGAWRQTPVPAASDPNPAALRRYLKVWAAVVFVFFSISGAKLPHYLLPALPPLALLLGDAWATWHPDVPLGRRVRFPVIWLLGLGAFAQFVFTAIYGGAQIGGLRVPGSQADIHALCRYVREHAAPTDTVAEYQMSRRDRELGTGHLKIQETSEPSTLLYLDRTVLDTEDWSAIINAPGPTWVITRWNRVGSSERKASGHRMKEVLTPVSREFYRLYRIETAR